MTQFPLFDDDPMHGCSVCGELLPMERFCRRGATRRMPRCKGCTSAYNRQYQAENAEEIKTQLRQYREQNAEKIRAQRAEYREQNPEKIKMQVRRYHELNPEKIAAGNKRWSRRNPENIRAKARRHRARKASAPGSHTVEQWAVLCNRYRGCCVRCGAQPVEEDHIVPLSRAGSDSIANIQPLCKPCNCGKGARHSTDYRYELYDWMA